MKRQNLLLMLVLVTASLSACLTARRHYSKNRYGVMEGIADAPTNDKVPETVKVQRAFSTFRL